MSPMPCIHLELNLWGYYRWSKISVNWSNHPVGVASGWLMVDMPMDGWHEYKMFTDAHRCASGLICRTLTHPYQTGSTMKYKISVTRGRTIEGKMWFTASTTIVIGDIVAGEVFKRKSQLGGSNSCRPGKRSKNDSARDNLTWSSHRTLLMRLMCLGRNEFANLSNLFSVTLNRDWDRLRYHRCHTEDGMNWEVLNFWHWIFDIEFLTYQNPLFVSDKYWYLWLWCSVFDADNICGALCTWLSVTAVATRLNHASGFFIVRRLARRRVPFFWMWLFPKCILLHWRCDNNNRRPKVHRN